MALRFLGIAAVGVIMALGLTAVARADTTTSLVAGVDVWHVPADPARYLPNYATETWQTAIPWVRAQVQHRTDTDFGLLTLTASGVTDPIDKGRIDRLDADLRMGRGGARLGILPYRVSWCRGRAGAWISEPDAFCRFAGLNEISEGAFGVQAYRSGVWSGWLVDGLVGAYRPMVDDQTDSLGPYVTVGPNVKHQAHGASANAMHLGTGLQMRFGWLRTDQIQDSSTGGYQRHIRYDTYYLAAEGNVAQKIELRASLAAYIGDQLNPANLYGWDGRSLTLEAAYRPSSDQSFAAGLSRYTNITTYTAPPNGQRVIVPSLSLAWRKDWPKGFYTVLQATRSLDDSTTRRGVHTERAGTAYGVRIAKTFQ